MFDQKHPHVNTMCDVSLPFVSSTAERVVLGPNTRPTEPLISQRLAWLPSLCAATACRARAIAVQDDRLLSRWRSHRFGALHFSALTRLHSA